MKPTRIIVFDDLFPGGLRTLNERLWHVYRDHRHTHTYVVVTGVNYDQSLQKATFPYADRVLSYPIPRMNQFKLFFYVCWHTFWIIRSFQKHHNTTTIIGNNSFSSFGARLAAWVSHIPFLYFYHGSLFEEVRSLRHTQLSGVAALRAAFMRWFYWGIQWFVVQTSQVVCFSTYATTLLNNHFSKRHVSLLTVPFVYQPTSTTHRSALRRTLGITPEHHVILFPSRIEPRKGLHVLIQALVTLPKTLKITLFVVGPLHGEAVEYLLGAIAPQNLDFRKQIYFVGEQRQKELSLFYKSADITVVPSIDLETFGMVTMESLSYGTPVVGFPSGATSTILRAIDTMLVARSMTAKALAKSIQHCLLVGRKRDSQLQQHIHAYVVAHHSAASLLREMDYLLREK